MHRSAGCLRSARLTALRVMVLALFGAGTAASQPVVNPRQVEFQPSADHAVVLSDGRPAVTEYRFELYSTGAAAPFHVVNLAKPAPGAGGLIRHDFSAQVGSWPLPGGTYEARVAAVGPHGTGRSAPSNPFTIELTPCAFSASPTTISMPAAAGSASVTIATTAGCAWTASSAASWMTVSPASGAGGGTVTVAATANAGTSVRTGTLTVAGRTITVTQSGSSTACSYLTSPTALSVGAGSDAASVAVTAPAGCAWTASSAASWVTVGPASGSGSGPVTVSVTPNPAAAARAATVTVAGRWVTVTQNGAACSYAVSPSEVSVGPAPSGPTIAVTAPTGCVWTASSGVPWMAVSPSSGSGSRSASISVAANPGTSPRTGSVTIAGRGVTVTQAGIECTFTVTPASLSVAVGAGTAGITVAAPAACGWTTSSEGEWVTVSPGSGSGTRSLAVSFTANPGVGARTALLTVAGETVAITQAGTACAFTVAPAALTVGAGATSSSLAIMGLATCSWTATSSVPWLTVTPSSGRGNATLSVAVTENASPEARLATLTVGGQTVTLTQARRPKPPGSLRLRP